MNARKEAPWLVVLPLLCVWVAIWEEIPRARKLKGYERLEKKGKRFRGRGSGVYRHTFSFHTARTSS
jgi:hypothetical protein